MRSGDLRQVGMRLKYVMTNWED